MTIPVLYRFYIRNISPETTEGELRALLQQFGAVKHAHVVKAISTGNPLGFAFVDMLDEQARARAVAGLNEVELHGRSLKVQAAP